MTDDVEPAGAERPGLLQALWWTRWTSLLIVVLVAGAALGLGLASSSGVTAQAAVGLAGRTSSAGGEGPLPSDVQSRYLSDQAAFVTSDAVLRTAAQRLGPGLTAGDLRGRVSAEPDQAANIIWISAYAASQEGALRTADAAVAAFREESRRQFQREAAVTLRALDEARRVLAANAATGTASTDEALEALLNRSVEVQVRAGTFGDGVRFSNPAIIVRPGLLSSPVGRSTLMGLALGGLMASLVALGRTSPNRTPRANRFRVPATSRRHRRVLSGKRRLAGEPVPGAPIPSSWGTGDDAAASAASASMRGASGVTSAEETGWPRCQGAPTGPRREHTRPLDPRPLDPRPYASLLPKSSDASRPTALNGEGSPLPAYRPAQESLRASGVESVALEAQPSPGHRPGAAAQIHTAETTPPSDEVAGKESRLEVLWRAGVNRPGPEATDL